MDRQWDERDQFGGRWDREASPRARRFGDQGSRGGWRDWEERWAGSGYGPAASGYGREWSGGTGQDYGRGGMDDQWSYGPSGYGQGRFGGYGGQGASWSTPMRWTYVEYWLIPGPMTGRGPRGYQRSDERIREEVCDRLTQHGQLDASDIDVQVANGELTLEGTVDNRQAKRMAEECVETVPGVREVHNRLRVRQDQRTQPGGSERLEQPSPAATGTGGATTGTSGMATAASTGSVSSGATAGPQTQSTGTGTTTGPTGATAGTTTASTGGTTGWEQARPRFQERFGQRTRSVGGTLTRTWDQAEPSYRFGWEAAQDQRFTNRRFEEIEPDLRRDWETRRTTSGATGDEARWEQLREEVREAFDLARGSA